MTETKTFGEIVKFDFKGNNVPVIMDDDGNPWWVANQVCKVLGIGNVSMALIEIDRRDKTSVSTTKDGGKISKLRIINESGLYDLIFKSRKPEAKEFKRWVTHEVLPAIRKTGGYIHTTPEMTDKEIMAKGYLVAMETIKERDRKIAEVEKVSHARKETIKVLHPKAVKYDKLMSTDTLVSISEGAKLYSSAWSAAIGPKKFAAGLRDMKIFYKKFDTNLPYQKYLDAGWFCVRETERGFRQTMITTEGMNKIVEIHPARFVAAWGTKAA